MHITDTLVLKCNEISILFIYSVCLLLANYEQIVLIRTFAFIGVFTIFPKCLYQILETIFQ